MSDLTMTGKILKVLEVEKGTSKAGKDWQKINFVLSTGSEYNPEVAFQIFGEERVESFIKYNKVGQVVDVSFNISSREYNGKYFHNLDAWKIFKSDSAEPNQAPLKEVELEKASAEDDLPF
jgi:hypothetical protein